MFNQDFMYGAKFFEQCIFQGLDNGEFPELSPTASRKEYYNFLQNNIIAYVDDQCRKIGTNNHLIRLAFYVDITFCTIYGLNDEAEELKYNYFSMVAAFNLARKTASRLKLKDRWPETKVQQCFSETSTSAMRAIFSYCEKHIPEILQIGDNDENRIKEYLTRIFGHNARDEFNRVRCQATLEFLRYIESLDETPDKGSYVSSTENSPEFGTINDSEECILEALGKIEALGDGFLKGEDLSVAAFGKHSSHAKGVLSSMVKRNILGNQRGKGYFKTKKFKEFERLVE